MDFTTAADTDSFIEEADNVLEYKLNRTSGAASSPPYSYVECAGEGTPSVDSGIPAHLKEIINRANVKKLPFTDFPASPEALSFNPGYDFLRAFDIIEKLKAMSESEKIKLIIKLASRSSKSLDAVFTDLNTYLKTTKK